MFRSSALLTLVPVVLLLSGCDRRSGPARAPADVLVTDTAPVSGTVQTGSPASPRSHAAEESFVGFDRNTYPGDERLAELHKQFAFTGYWLNNPPGGQNSWTGHRQDLVNAGFGFVVLWNGRLDAEIRHAQAMKTSPETLGSNDARNAIAAARREGFPAGTIIFLDQEEGGRLLPEQSSYFFAFTEALAQSAYKAGSYLSGQAADDGPGNASGGRRLITTAEDVRQTIATRHLHPIALWVAQDACPPAPGCTVAPQAIAALHPGDSGTLDASIWQYAQSPQRPELTQACAATYAKDGNCHAGSEDLFFDLDLANSSDPSHGR